MHRPRQHGFSGNLCFVICQKTNRMRRQKKMFECDSRTFFSPLATRMAKVNLWSPIKASRTNESESKSPAIVAATVIHERNSRIVWLCKSAAVTRVARQMKFSSSHSPAVLVVECISTLNLFFSCSQRSANIFSVFNLIKKSEKTRQRGIFLPFKKPNRRRGL